MSAPSHPPRWKVTLGSFMEEAAFIHRVKKGVSPLYPEVQGKFSQGLEVEVMPGKRTNGRTGSELIVTSPNATVRDMEYLDALIHSSLQALEHQGSSMREISRS